MIFSVIGFKLFAQLGFVFMLGRCLTSLLWGAIVDRIGRKPLILAGIISVVIFNTLFGLSKSFWMAILTRFLLGCFNGFLGPVRNCISTPTSHVVIGLIIGPSLRGYLAQVSILLAQPHNISICTCSSNWLHLDSSYFCPALSKAVKTMKKGEKVILSVKPQFKVIGKLQDGTLFLKKGHDNEDRP